MPLGAPEPHYVSAGEIELAYAVLGVGERTIVRVTGLGPSLDDAAQAGTPWRLVERLSAVARVVLFDRRGQGLSTRSFGFGTAEDRMDDIGTVMDALGVDRAVLLADHDGAAFALMFAAAYPERVTALVLHNVAAPRLRWSEDYPIGLPDELVDAYVDYVGAEWGSGRVSGAFSSDLVDRATLARTERAMCTPRMAQEHFRRSFLTDVRDALGAIAVPVLVVHGADEPTPVSWAQYLVDHLRDAVLVESSGHALFGPEHAADGLLDRVEEFVTGERPRPVVDVDRVLATVLFVVIVGSTEQLARMGDRRWRDLLNDFRSALRAEIARYRGREVDTAGDGVLATFDGSTRAVRCAIAIVHAASVLGLDVRAGAHSGEVELLGDGVAGIAVHVGARVCGAAGAREVLVTPTLRDLVAGSGLEFETRGAHSLKGVPDPVELFAVVR